MPILYITCPKTNKRLLTGLSADKPLKPGTFGEESLRCRHCRQMHTWHQHDLYFRGDPKKKPPGQNPP
jgi:hypothetical protein